MYYFATILWHGKKLSMNKREKWHIYNILN